MVEVDINIIQKCVEKLISYSSELEQIHLDLFNQLKNSCMNWQDGNSQLFEDAVYLDKNEALELLNNLKNKKDVFLLIYEKYKTIGNKIKCNFNNKKAVLNAIDGCYNQACEIVNNFSWIDRSFWYDELYYINNQQYKLEKVKSDLKTLRNNIKKLFDKIEKIESEIQASIKKLESFNVKKFDFDEEMITL